MANPITAKSADDTGTNYSDKTLDHLEVVMEDVEAYQWLMAPEQPKPKPKPMPRHMTICFKHKQRQYGKVPCDKCMAEEKFFKNKPDYLEDLRNANIFAKHTGVWFAAMDPGVRFGIKHQWWESFDVPSGVLKLIAEKLESKKMGS